jgi:hypothetical protein
MEKYFRESMKKMLTSAGIGFIFKSADSMSGPREESISDFPKTAMTIFTPDPICCFGFAQVASLQFVAWDDGTRFSANS